MKILFIAAGFLPDTMSENLCNGKLVLAFLSKGWEVDVISKKNENSYHCGWEEPWMKLKPITHIIEYPHGGKIGRSLDLVRCIAKMNGYPLEGIRWAYRAYKEALRLHKEKKYDVIITRSPSDIAHIVGFKFNRKTKIPWIANWNDPATNTWPLSTVSSKWSWKLHEKYNRHILSHATLNSFPATTLRDHFTKHYNYIDKKKCVVFPHIALAEDLIANINYPKSQNAFRMCHAGNISIYRDIDYLLKAIKELKENDEANIRFDILGSNDQYTIDLVEKKYNLADSIRFIGPFSYPEAMSKMQTYDVLVLIEQRLEFGIFFPSKLVDYAQLRKPILAISPKNGFVNTQMTLNGGGICTDNADYTSVKAGLNILYKAWKDNDLSAQYSTEKLLDSSTPESLLKNYETAFKNLNIQI